MNQPERRSRIGPIAARLAGLALLGGLAATVYMFKSAADKAHDQATNAARRADTAQEEAKVATQRLETFARAAWQAAPIEAGEVFFVTRLCVTCHTIDGRRWTGPTMKNLYGSTVEFADGGTAVADLAFLEGFILGTSRRTIAGFGPMMPLYAGQMDPGTLRSLTLYIMSLSAGHEQEAREKAAEVQREYLRSLAAPAGAATPSPS